MVPIVGNLPFMTLRDYIKSGNSDIGKMAEALGVSEHAVRKWYYGQRAPRLKTMLQIERITGGKVKVASFADAAA